MQTLHTLAETRAQVRAWQRAGETVAFVGPSGVGKTTLLSLVPRFYDVEEGRITVDGHDVRDLTLPSLRGQIGIVQQDVFLFAGTLRENIAYGRLGATEAGDGALGVVPTPEQGLPPAGAGV